MKRLTLALSLLLLSFSVSADTITISPDTFTATITGTQPGLTNVRNPRVDKFRLDCPMYSPTDVATVVGGVTTHSEPVTVLGNVTSTTTAPPTQMTLSLQNGSNFADVIAPGVNILSYAATVNLSSNVTNVTVLTRGGSAKAYTTPVKCAYAHLGVGMYIPLVVYAPGVTVNTNIGYIWQTIDNGVQ